MFGLARRRRRDAHYREVAKPQSLAGERGGGKKIKKQGATPIANTDDLTFAADAVERPNDDEARCEEDQWSA